jgi:NAD(P)-dependent dehydrogenase (short-subunit alcohol dehydrogenase family)
MADDYRTALIVGSGQGLSASLARAMARQGMKVALAARNTDKLADLCAETGARAIGCDVSDAAQVARLFAEMDREPGAADVVVFNASARVRGPFTSLAAADVQKVMMTDAMGAFTVAQEAARRMVPRGRGAILFTGASASVKGYAQSAPFAMGKFAVRGLAQSLARELQPKGIHVGHFIIDGMIRNPGRSEPADSPDSTLDPDAIAANYLALLRQPRSTWTWELELRPWVEKF